MDFLKKFAKGLFGILCLLLGPLFLVAGLGGYRTDKTMSWRDNMLGWLVISVIDVCVYFGAYMLVVT